MQASAPAAAPQSRWSSLNVSKVLALREEAVPALLAAIKAGVIEPCPRLEGRIVCIGDVTAEAT